jgi:hypothetical protein
MLQQGLSDYRMNELAGRNGYEELLDDYQYGRIKMEE